MLSNIDQPDDSLDDEVVQNHHQSRKSAMTAISDFDPDAFLVVPARTCEDLRIGEVFRAPSRTLTDAHAPAVQTVSMDNHPLHYDAEWARKHGHVAPVVHGLQVLAFTAPGATLFPHFIGEVFIRRSRSPAWSRRGTTASWSQRSPSTTSAGNSCCRASTSTCCGVSGPYGTAMAEHQSPRPAWSRKQRESRPAGDGAGLVVVNNELRAMRCRACN